MKKMKNINIFFLGLAIVTVIAMGSIGIAIAEGSIVGVICLTIATIALMGFGFIMKKKMREGKK